MHGLSAASFKEDAINNLNVPISYYVVAHSIHDEYMLETPFQNEKQGKGVMTTSVSYLSSGSTKLRKIQSNEKNDHYRNIYTT